MYIEKSQLLKTTQHITVECNQSKEINEKIMKYQTDQSWLLTAVYQLHK